MKLENFRTASNLVKQLERVRGAMEQAEYFLSKKKINQNGNDFASEDGLYQLHISEFRDGSGLCIDLTGCMVGIEIINSVLVSLRKREEHLLKEIEKID